MLQYARTIRRPKINMEALARKVYNKAYDLCPVRSGYLRSTIEVWYDDNEIEVIATAPYAIYVEMGTEKMSAQPFLRPALEVLR